MTNSEAIAVAEEVWRWDKKHLIDIWMDFGPEGSGFEVWRADYLQKEVNSWSGFGRTVEAMAGKNKEPSLGDLKCDLVASFEGFLCGGITKEMLWERIHTAALEAVRGERG